MPDGPDNPDRRTSLGWVAAVAGSALAACSRSFFPDSGVDVSIDVPPAVDASADDADAEEYPSDPIQVLNALLSTEFRAIKAYDLGAMLIGAAPATDPLASLKPTLLEVATHFQNQHRDHASLLIETVQVLGGTALRSTAVDFLPPSPFNPTITNVLKLACNAEKAAARLYAGSTVWLHTGALRGIPASIVGVEAQHFIVLYAILKGLAQPGSQIAGMTQRIVPTSLVTSVVGIPGLDTIADFQFR